jgi:hypothetical protein
MLFMMAALLHYHVKRDLSISVQPSDQPRLLPPLNPDLLLSQVNWVMSHDAATGYIDPSGCEDNVTCLNPLLVPYVQTQAPGTAYDQLQAGARVLDLRVHLQRRIGQELEVVFHHGAVVLAGLTMDRLLSDVLRWCRHHPTELVLLLTSHYSYSATHDPHQPALTPQDMVQTLSDVYARYHIPYWSCRVAANRTVGQIMNRSSSTTELSLGNLLALDGQFDSPGSFCAKENYVESKLVACYREKLEPRGSLAPDWKHFESCTQPKQYPELQQALFQYLHESMFNPPTDDESRLGPPTAHSAKLWNQVQALWQINRFAVEIGMLRGSSILQDNIRSDINTQIYNWLSTLPQQSDSRVGILLTLDNVSLHGNEILSVLRNMCGQTISTVGCYDQGSSSIEHPRYLIRRPKLVTQQAQAQSA